MSYRIQKKQRQSLSAIPNSSTDPWSAVNESLGENKEGWMWSYIDVLTLLLTLLVLLLAFQKIEHKGLIAKSLKEPGISFVERQAMSRGSDHAEQVAERFNGNPDSKQTRPDGDSETKLSDVEGKESFSSTHEIARASVLLTELAKSDPDQVDVVQEGRSIRIEVNDGVLFASGHGNLKADAGKILNKWADLLKQQAGTIFVEGHTDSLPIANHRYPSNWELSSARAGSVTRYFLEQGVPPSRLRTVGYADTRPRANNNTVEGRTENRRVSIVIQL